MISGILYLFGLKEVKPLTDRMQPVTFGFLNVCLIVSMGEAKR